VVDLEVLHPEGFVTLLAVYLAFHFAVLIGTLPADVAPGNHKMSHTVMTKFPAARCGKHPSAIMLASGGIPLPNLRTCPRDGTHNLLHEVQCRQVSNKFLVQRLVILDSGVQDSGDNAVVPLMFWSSLSTPPIFELYCWTTSG
jgi:hypothetical protein